MARRRARRCNPKDQAYGEYRVSGRTAPVAPVGGADAASRTFQDGPFKEGAPGAAMVRVGKHRLTTSALVTPCAAFLSPYEGVLFVGINSQDPSKARGDLEFDVAVRPATAAEWHTGTVAECKPAAQDDNGEFLAAFTAKAVERLKADAGLAADILKNTHPSSDKPSLHSIDVDPGSKASARVFVTVDWAGGFFGNAQSTRIAWEFNRQRHIAATLFSDSANVVVTPDYLKKLDAYFRDVVFPAVK